MKLRVSAILAIVCVCLSAQKSVAEKNVEFTSDLGAAFSEDGLRYWAPGDLLEKEVQTQYEKSLGQDKAAFIWKRMQQTRYDVVPEITGPGLWGFLRLLNPFSNSQALTHNGDFMIKDREKDIHHFGTSVMVQFVPQLSPFTGIFKSGADYGVARFSMAKPSAFGNSTPGMGIKFFVDAHESVNMEAMYLLTGQEGYDVFQNNFTNVLPNPHGDFGLKLLGFSFGWGLWYAGQGSGDPKALSSNHIARIRQNGSKVESPISPFQLIFVPTKEAQALLADASEEKDFRELLEGKGKGIELYHLYGNTEPATKMRLIGTIKTTSNFVASKFGDEELYFKHHGTHPTALTDEL